MDFYAWLVLTYNNFLTLFPPDVQWVASLAIILIFIAVFVGLIRKNLLFGLLLIPVLPFLLPPFAHFFTDMWHFFTYVLHTGTTPRT
jgi:hypothetical protein